jgi:acetyl-CoA carboxylase biotin carboxyl carrier protein
MTIAHNDRLSADDLAKILELVEKSDFDTIELSIGDFHFSASRNGATAQAAKPAPAAQQPSPQMPAAPTAPPTAPVDDPALIPVKAPIVGIFYTSPEPGAAPFVREGDRIEAGSTVGLIEVMKVFNAVTAGISGTVMRCLVEDSELVEHGQPLFLIRPEGV